MHRLPLALALLAAGCGSLGSSSREADVFWPTAGCRHHLATAHGDFVEHYTERSGGARESLERVLPPLALAAESDGRIALVPGLEGRIRLDLAELAAVDRDSDAAHEQLQNARAAFERSVQLSRDWVPGHLGLARLAILEGDWKSAEDSIVAAAKALARVNGVVREEPSLLEGLFGLDFTPERPRDPLATVPTRAERRGLILSQLAESERWSLNLAEVESLVAGGLQGDQLLRRLRDRIALARADLELARALEDGVEESEAYRHYAATITHDVLAREGDLVEAYLSRAVAAYSSGDLRSAVSDLTYLAEADLPLLRANASLDQQLAALLEELETPR